MRLLHTLKVTSPMANQGYSLCYIHPFLYVGAPNAQAGDRPAGAVFAFNQQADWAHTKTITDPNPTGQPGTATGFYTQGDRFGQCLDEQDGQLVVSAPYHDGGTRNPAANRGKILYVDTPYTKDGDTVGRSLACCGENILLGANGYAVLHTPTHTEMLYPPEYPLPEYGRRVALREQVAAVTSTGQIHIFTQYEQEDWAWNISIEVGWRDSLPQLCSRGLCYRDNTTLKILPDDGTGFFEFDPVNVFPTDGIDKFCIGDELDALMWRGKLLVVDTWGSFLFSKPRTSALEGQAMCWIDDNTLAVGNPLANRGEGEVCIYGE